ncbi:MAG: DUF1254 domain-containing protein [Hyphomicrobiales bacterium]|nr:DUF1254 domain-containing protein [Hyphomicrobiales bacterium]
MSPRVSSRLTWAPTLRREACASRFWPQASQVSGACSRSPLTRIGWLRQNPLAPSGLPGRRALGSAGPFGSPALLSGEADAVSSADPPGSPFCRLSSRRYGSSLEGGRELVRESSDKRAFCARVSARSLHAVASKSSCDSVARSAGVKAFKSSANRFGTQGVESPSRRCASPKCAKSSIPPRYAATAPHIVTTGRNRRSVNGYPEETKYIYTDDDGEGQPLDGRNAYAITFAKGETPPVKGFWSLTLYNEEHFFNPNALGRYSLGTKNKTLKYNADGSLTLYAGAKSPGADKEMNWLPAPDGHFSLYIRAYWADEAILNGRWKPPAVTRVQ